MLLLHYILLHTVQMSVLYFLLQWEFWLLVIVYFAYKTNGDHMQYNAFLLDETNKWCKVNHVEQPQHYNVSYGLTINYLPFWKGQLFIKSTFTNTKFQKSTCTSYINIGIHAFYAAYRSANLFLLNFCYFFALSASSYLSILESFLGISDSKGVN